MALGALALAGTACQPLHFGASIMNQANVYGGDFDGPVYATPGDTPGEGADTMAAHVDEQSGAIVIADFEHNGILDGTWGTDDRNQYYRMLFMRPRCTVVVLGWRLPPIPAALDTARADIRALADQRATLGYPTVVVDWRPEVLAHPEYISADGVHISDDPQGGTTESTDADTAYTDLIRDGIARCP